MTTIIRTKSIAYFCPICEHKTAGIILENGKRVCPLCKRELRKCISCKNLTFGSKKDPHHCLNCQAVFSRKKSARA